MPALCGAQEHMGTDMSSDEGASYVREANIHVLLRQALCGLVALGTMSEQAISLLTLCDLDKCLDHWCT